MRMEAHLGQSERNPRGRRWWLAAFSGLAAVLLVASLASAQEVSAVRAAAAGEEFELEDFGLPLEMQAVPATRLGDANAGDLEAQPVGLGLPAQLPDLTRRENLGPALQLVILLTVLSLAPAILVLCTSFTRIIIVLSLLRQAIGTQNLPPNQVLIGLSLFMTCVVMSPTWSEVNEDAVRPYLDGQITQEVALEKGILPVRAFMIDQIINAGNDETVDMFHRYSRLPEPTEWDEVSTVTLIPAFVLSELEVAFLMGFKIYLPFLVIDMVISAVLISMGMMMLPPVLISLPFKLLLFVLVDGWMLIVGSLMGSFMLTGG